MTRPTPTEEHVEFAERLLRECLGFSRMTASANAWGLAYLLAEREAPLRERAEKAERRNREGISAHDDVDAAGWVERVSHALGRFYDYDGPFVAAESDTVVALIQETARRHVAAEAALAASRAEVEALRELLRRALAPVDAAWCRAVSLEDDTSVVEFGQVFEDITTALSSTPAPASAERCPGVGPKCDGSCALTEDERAIVDASAEPATPTTFAGRQMCNMTNCGGSVEMYWTAAYSKRGKCSRCNCAVQCSTTEAGPLATPTTEGGAK